MPWLENQILLGAQWFACVSSMDIVEHRPGGWVRVPAMQHSELLQRVSFHESLGAG